MKLCIYISLRLSSRNKSASGLSPQEKSSMWRVLEEWSGEWLYFSPVVHKCSQAHFRKGESFEQTYKWFTINSILYSVLAAIKLFFSFVEQPGIHQRQPKPALKKSILLRHSLPCHLQLLLCIQAAFLTSRVACEPCAYMCMWGQTWPSGIREVWINSFSYEVSITL